MTLTTIWSLIMPPVKCSLYFYKEKEPVISSIAVINRDMGRTNINGLNNGYLDKTNIKVCKVINYQLNNIFTK